MSKILYISFLVFLFTGCQSASKDAGYAYTFGRVFQKNIQPRGGTTKGPAGDLDSSASEFFVKINKTSSKKEKDRLAILSQVGEFKVSFEFVETLNLSKKRALDKPYYSWATEYIFPIESKPDFISLQHILVMRFTDDKGKVSDPMVVKHWRQDWTYQKSRTFKYSGANRWTTYKPKSSEIRGMWVQEVFQVDDSPRYSSYGLWKHGAKQSTWRGAYTKRPLPRREHSVRNDYDALAGVNTVIVTPNAWYHLQNNEKLVTGTAGVFKNTVGTEVGVNKYVRIKNYDFEKGREYWAKTSGYWQKVRAEWDRILTHKNSFSMPIGDYGKRLYKEHFKYAEELNSGKRPSMSFGKHARKTIEDYISY